MKKHIIPIFIPHYGCTYRCVFCNQKKITGVSTNISQEYVANFLRQHVHPNIKDRFIEVAFYGGSFTALPWDIQCSLLQPATSLWKSGAINSIRISTRPDAIDAPLIKRLGALGVRTIELGAQSLCNSVLELAGRGHSAEQIADAVKIIRTGGLECGLQLMIGLPGETWLEIIRSAAQVLLIKPDFTRLYPTLVIANTELADLYRAGQYKPLSISEAVARAAYYKVQFERGGIGVIRTGLQATEELADPGNVLAGPYHPAFGELVDAYIFNIMVSRIITNMSETTAKLVIHHHPRDHSKLRGMANANLRRWQQTYSDSIELKPDAVKLGELVIEAGTATYIINKNMLYFF